MRAVEIGLDAWSECIKLVLVGDLHLGNSQTNEALVDATAERLKAPDTYWIDLGDSIDAINMSDPRFDPRSMPEWIGLRDLVDLPAAQTARYRHYFGRLGKTCWARLYGNHELQLQRHSERDVYAELNRAIALDEDRALGYSGFVRIRFRERKGAENRVVNTWTQTLYITHGHGGGRLAGAKALKLERLPMAYDADVYVMGHTHAKLVLQKRRVGVAPRKVEVEDRQLLLVNVGAYLDGREGYPEYKGLYPQALGPIELWFYPSRHEIRVIQ